MRKATTDMIKKIHDELIKRDYVKIEDLCSITRLSPNSIYRLIRLMRLQGIGILPTHKGYILAEFADKKDDVSFIRRCYGRRTSDIISIKAAEKYIVKRWRGIKNKSNIQPVLSHLTAGKEDTLKAENGVKYLLSYINNSGN